MASDPTYLPNIAEEKRARVREVSWMLGEISRVGVGPTCTKPNRRISVPTYHQTGEETVSERPLSSPPFPPPPLSPPPDAKDGQYGIYGGGDLGDDGGDVKEVGKSGEGEEGDDVAGSEGEEEEGAVEDERVDDGGAAVGVERVHRIALESVRSGC